MIPYRVRSPIPQLRASFHSPRLRRRALIASVFSMGCLHLIIAIASVQQKSATFDEVAHVTAGYSYWKQNDYRLHPENGNLPQRWIVKDVAGLYFSALHIGLNRQDFLRFVRRYSELPLRQCLQEQKHFWAQVQARAMRMDRKLTPGMGTS